MRGAQKLLRGLWANATWAGQETLFQDLGNETVHMKLAGMCNSVSSAVLVQQQRTMVSLPQEDDHKLVTTGMPYEDTFYAHDIRWELKNESERIQERPKNPRFGEMFTDHMLVVQHEVGQGWDRPVVQAVRPINIHPGCQAIHYGMSCFEGMKAYRGVDGSVRLFRPALNMMRLLRSARRLDLPGFSPDELLACIEKLIIVDKSWIPKRLGHSLYIRPVLYSSSPMLGVASPTQATLNVLLSPSGSYFASSEPIKMFIDEKHTRAWPGGAGDCKVSGNYAPSIYPQAVAAKQHGAHQVLFTFNPKRHMQEKESIDEVEFEECGAMNIFFVLDYEGGIELVTPQLRGTILPGITRASIVDIVGEWGDIQVSQRRISLGEVLRASRSGKLKEIFACGTASVVQPVGCLVRHNGEEFKPEHSFGPLTGKIYKHLVRIQHGVIHHPWSHKIGGK